MDDTTNETAGRAATKENGKAENIQGEIPRNHTKDDYG